MSAGPAHVMNVAVAVRAPIESDLHVVRRRREMPSVVVHVGDRASVHVASAEAARSVAAAFEAAAAELEAAVTRRAMEALG